MDASPFQPQASHTYVTERERERGESTHNPQARDPEGTDQATQPTKPTDQGETRGGQRKPADDAFITFPRSTGGLCGHEHPGMNPCHGHATRPGLPDVGILRLRGFALSPPSGPWGFVEGLRQVHHHVGCDHEHGQTSVSCNAEINACHAHDAKSDATLVSLRTGEC